MENIFSENINKKIPKTAKDCIKPDYISASLWTWAQGIEHYGYIILVITIILGVILTLLSLFAVGAIALLLPIPIAFTALVEYLTYHTIALLLGALASIVQNTSISANVAMLSINNSCDAETRAEDEPNKGLPPEPFVWQPTDFSTAVRDGETNIKCTNCHRVQFKGNKRCSQCGAVFIEIE